MHFMIDSETLGVNPGTGLILQMSVVPFDLGDPQKDQESVAWHSRMKPFNMHVKMKGQIGRTVDEGTLKWWLKENPSLLLRLLEVGDSTLESMICEIGIYFKQREHRIDGVWSHGENFDIAFIDNLFDERGLQRPWKFRDSRDTRTLFWTAAEVKPDFASHIKRSDFGEAHNALNDCRYQVAQMQAAYLAITGKATGVLGQAHPGKDVTEDHPTDFLNDRTD